MTMNQKNPRIEVCFKCYRFKQVAKTAILML